MCVVPREAQAGASLAVTATSAVQYSILQCVSHVQLAPTTVNQSLAVPHYNALKASRLIGAVRLRLSLILILLTSRSLNPASAFTYAVAVTHGSAYNRRLLFLPGNFVLSYHRTIDISSVLTDGMTAL